MASGRRLRVVPPQRPTGRRFTMLRIGLFGGLVGITGIVVLAFLTVFVYSRTIPKIASVSDYRPKVGTRIYAADGQLVGVFAAERREIVAVDKIPKHLLQAFVSAEDQRFYDHGGMDFLGMLKAVADKLIHPMSKLRGASTITQQVAKSLLATQETFAAASARTLSRKIREALLARDLEANLEKSDILYIYVNQIFLGNKAYGIQAAAQHYFRKNVWDLSLAEMATIAGLPQRPSAYSPHTQPEAALARRRYVLRRMLEDEAITQEEHDVAVKENITAYPAREHYLLRAPYYTEEVRRELEERFGEKRVLEDGLQVYTGLDLAAQDAAHHAVVDGLMALDHRQGYRGPLLHLEKKDWKRFVEAYRKQLDLDKGMKLSLEEGEPYIGLVERIGGDDRVASVNVAGVETVLPLAAMRWARALDATELAGNHYITKITDALHEGDVIWVRPSTMEKLSEDPHAQWNISSVTRAVLQAPPGAELVELWQIPATQAALLSVDPFTGNVVSVVGGFDFSESNYNRATQACREPGSAFKPVVYAAAIEKLKYTPSTMIDDKPFVYHDLDNNTKWKPSNAGHEFRGHLPLRTCLQDSVNTPAVRVAEAVGLDDVIGFAGKLGINTPFKRELGIALGSSCTELDQLINAYVTFNQGGVRRPLRYITRIIDREGKVIEDQASPWDPLLDLASRLDRTIAKLDEIPEQAISPQTAFMMVSLLQNVVEAGTARGVSYLGFPVAGKTGTTNDAYDAWFMGFSRDLVAGVWVGYDRKDGPPLGVGEQGSRTALPIWRDYMSNTLRDHMGSRPYVLAQGEFEPPKDMVQVLIDPETGLLARPTTPNATNEYYVSGSEPTEYVPDGTLINADQVDVFGADVE